MSQTHRPHRTGSAPRLDAQHAGDGRDGWSHEAGLRTAWSLLRERSFPDAIASIRKATPPAALHATRLLAWARLVDAAIARSGADADFDGFLGAHPELGDADHLLAHYSPGRLATPRAQREFVLPDRAPLPAPSRRGDRGGVDPGREGTKTVSSG